MHEKGLFIIYTGDGKGKTTAALGCAVRAMGHGFRVCMIQFIKQCTKSGEIHLAEHFPGLFDLYVTGKGFIKEKTKGMTNHERAAKKAWRFTKETIRSSSYDLIILDELTYLIDLSFIGESEIVGELSARPEHLHIIVTGRRASPLLIETADLVTDMKEIKHPFHNGRRAQKGIEW
ncbi:MAG: cob(I)yrinic acid a,c-diamide adenosyltransferase [Spirochaetales bacterium]|nr:cob(I)yrinic acid a,c-diamide adenosyltransferase [Spirochaetales bacterium]